MPPLLDYLERVIPASGFLVEDRLTLADISVASPFANFVHIDTLPDAGRHPRLAPISTRSSPGRAPPPGSERETAFLDLGDGADGHAAVRSRKRRLARDPGREARPGEHRVDIGAQPGIGGRRRAARRGG